VVVEICVVLEEESVFLIVELTSIVDVVVVVSDEDVVVEICVVLEEVSVFIVELTFTLDIVVVVSDDVVGETCVVIEGESVICIVEPAFIVDVVVVVESSPDDDTVNCAVLVVLLSEVLINVCENDAVSTTDVIYPVVACVASLEMAFVVPVFVTVVPKAVTVCEESIKVELVAVVLDPVL
jgi:hypothetical protein